MSLQKKLLLLLLLGFANSVTAIDKFPDKPGVSGFFNLGAGVASVKSNMVAGNDFADVSKETITSLTASPDSESDTMPVLNFELAYTFDGSRTQIFGGNVLEDLLRFDFATQIGVRRSLGDSGIIAVSYLFSSIPTEVWADPYVTNQPRIATDRESNGGRIIWDRILGSNFQVQYTKRDIELDNELSGQIALGLTAAQAALLNREGDQQALEVLYRFKIGNNQQLVPAIKYNEYDLDGKAVAYDGYLLQVTHSYTKNRFTLLTNVAYGSVDYDAVNPIYNQTREDDRYGLGFTAFFRDVFGTKGWTGVVNIVSYKDDANIDFYETEVVMFTLSALHRF